MRAGQQRALRQLRSIEAAREGGLEVLEVCEPETDGEDLCVVVSLDCRGFERAPTGIALRGREPVSLHVPARFPIAYPRAYTQHGRWRGTPHVQWGNFLCVYASPATEWQPSDGMFGFLDRLSEWLQAAALDQLDPDGVAVHPPVAYVTPGAPLIVPRAEAPEVSEETWFGWALANTVHDHRVDIVDWTPLREDGELIDPPIGGLPAVLLPSALDWEYPRNAADLFVALAKRCGDAGELMWLLEHTALHSDGEPLLVVVGTASRGRRGETMHQHLTVWRLPVKATTLLWRSLGRLMKDEAWQKRGTAALDDFVKWLLDAKVEWCPVREARPEVTVRRDEGSPMRWFQGKTVAVWGCGAIGSALAEWLVRADVARIILRDNTAVSPGILVRQNFVDADIGYGKADALAERLRAISPGVDVVAHLGNVLLGPLTAGPWHDNADVVLDATASNVVSTALEPIRATDPSRPMATFAFGHTAEHGLLVVAPAGRSEGPLDLTRQAKLAATRRGLRRFLAEFWPDQARTDLFQPEPGCSDPTFTGSAVENAALSALMLREAARELAADGVEPAATFIALEGADGGPAQQVRVALHAAFEVQLHDDLSTRVSPEAMAQMRAEVEASARLRGADSETGGLLFGERDEAAGVLWVSEATPPPPDSQHSPELFVCGVAGVRQTVASRRRRGHGALELVGTWHTHPVSGASPSTRDLAGMAEILAAAESPLARALLVIIGRAAVEQPALGAYEFERSELSADVIEFSGRQRRMSRDLWPQLPRVEPPEKARATRLVSRKR